MIFKNLAEEKIFLFIVVIFGPLILLLTPPMCTPDENTHFLNAYAFANGDFFPEWQEGEMGRFIPQAVSDFISSHMEQAVDLEEKYDFSKQYLSSFLPNENGELVFWNMGQLAAINPIGYLVSGAGIWTGRLLCGSVCGGYDTPYNLLLFARFFHLLFYAVTCYYALKKAPFLKKSMLVILTMPMSLFLGVSVSYDAILIPVCSLFFANTMGLLVLERMVCKTDIFITGLCTLFMVGIKTAYAPFLLLLLLVPREKFGTHRKYIGCVCLTLATGLVSYFGYQTCLQAILGEFSVNANEQAAAHRAYVFSHIGKIPIIAVQTLQMFGSFYLQSFYGKLGQLDTNFPLPVMCFFYGLFLFILAGEVCSVTKPIPKKIRIVDSLLVLVCISGIFLNMYLEWTPIVLGVGADVVSGVQGRYFIPLFIYLCFPFLNGLLAGKENCDRICRQTGALCSEILVIQSAALTSMILLVRYWI